MTRLSTAIERIQRFAGSPKDPEKIIAASRLMLVFVAIVMVFIDPVLSANRTALLILALFGFASIVLAFIAYRSATTWSTSALVWGGLAIDAVLPIAAVMVSRGPESTIFPLPIFAVAIAAYRWQLLGSLIVAAWTLFLIFISDGTQVFSALPPSPYEFRALATIRMWALVGIALVLGYFSTSAARRKRQLTALSALRRSSAQDLRELLMEELHAMHGTLNVRRVIATFTARDAFMGITAVFEPGTLHLTEEMPFRDREAVPAWLTTRDFILDGLSMPALLTLVDHDKGSTSVTTATGTLALAGIEGMRRVISVAIRGSIVEGRLFLDSQQSPTLEHLSLSRIMASQLAGRLDVFVLSQRLRRVAVLEERQRLSRELHDGVLQSITGATMSVHAARHMLTTYPDRSRALLQATEDLLRSEQKELRGYLDALSAEMGASAFVPSSSLADDVRRVSRRLAVVWGVEINIINRDDLSGDSPVESREVVRLIQEAVANAARHGHATVINVTISVRSDGLQIRVADNGQGFMKKGFFAFDTLRQDHFGPRKLVDRLHELGGHLSLDSTSTGSTLVMTIPNSLDTPFSED